MLEEQERAYFALGGGDDGLGDDDAAAGVVGAAADEGEEDEDESVALARALMEEERAQWRARMLQMAVHAVDEETGVVYSDDDGVDTDAMTYEDLTALGERMGTQARSGSHTGFHTTPLAL